MAERAASRRRKRETMSWSLLVAIRVNLIRGHVKVLACLVFRDVCIGVDCLVYVCIYIYLC